MVGAVILLAGCAEEPPPPNPDPDGDGWIEEDCDPLDPDVHPLQVEVCGDGRDNDCDGQAVGCGPAGVSSGWVGDVGTFEPGSVPGMSLGASLAHAGGAVVAGAPLASAGGEVVWLDGSERAVAGASIGGRFGVALAGTETHLLVGAPSADEAWILPADPDSAAPADEIGLRIAGHEQYAGAGAAIAMSDLDGDGVDDAVVGAPWADNTRGAVYVFGDVGLGDRSTADADTAWRAEDPSGLGAWLGTGDLDGDGVDDLVFSSQEGWTAVSDAPGEPQVLAEAEGRRAVALCDIDLDGRADVVSAQNFDIAVHTAATGWSSGSPTSSYSDDVPVVSCGGDSDGDGTPELVVVRAYWSVSELAWHELVGAVDGSIVNTGSFVFHDVSAFGYHPTGLLWTVADGDSYDDLLIGVWDADDGGPDAGGVWYVRGGPGL